MPLFLHEQPENRWQAFGIHLLASLLLFICMCTIIVVFWYPGVLFTTEGGWQGIRLIAGIDFVIGPTLTLLIYKKGKKGLQYDLMLIALLQTMCICYGMSIVNGYKPVVIAYADNTFYVIPAIRFESRNVKTDGIPLLQGRHPIRVNIKLPADKAKRLAVIYTRVPALDTAVDLYEPFDHALQILPSEGYSLAEAQQAGLEIPENLRGQDHYRVFRLFTRYGLYAVAVDVRTGDFEQILGSIDPGSPGLVPLSKPATKKSINTN